MAEPASTGQSIVSLAAKEAAGDTLRLVVIPVAAIISLAVGLVALLSGQSPSASVGFGLLALVSIMTAFLAFFNGRLRAALTTALGSKDALLNERKDWEVRLATAEKSATDRNAVAQDRDHKAEALAQAEARLAAAEAVEGKLTSDLTSLRKELDNLKGQLAAAQAAREAADANTANVRTELATARKLVAEERAGTSRAAVQPLIRPSIEIVPGGFLKPKNVQVVVENIGKGNATDVQVSGGGGSGTNAVPTTAINYYPAIKPGERLWRVVGPVSDFSGWEWFGVQVAYSGAFGPMKPVGLKRSFR